MSGGESNTGLLVMASVMITLSVLSIVFRFWSPIIVHQANFGLDDWLALASLPFDPFVQSVGIWFCHHGLRMHADQISPIEVMNTVKIVYIGSTLFDVSITLYKLSTLAFYLKVFGFRRNPSLTSTGRLWQISFIFVTVVTIAFPIFGIPLFIGVCSPTQKLWNPGVPGHCLWKNDNQRPWAVFNFISDLLILLLPMPMLFRLNMRMQRKLLFAATLAIGYSVPTMSLGRVITLSQQGDRLSTDPSYALYPLCFWLSAESALGIFVVSLPALFQLAQRWYGFGTMSLFTSRNFGEIQRARANIERSSNRKSRVHRPEPYDLGRSDGWNTSHVYGTNLTGHSDCTDLMTQDSSVNHRGGEAT